MKIITSLKQGSQEWLKARAGKVSGTKLGTVMGGPKAQETLMYELIAETISPLEKTYQNEAMERGTYLEPFAIKEYEKQTKDKVIEVGLIEKDEFHILSPDGIIYENDVITKAIEVKCLSAKKMLKYLINSIDKVEKTYYWQVINYFLVIDTLQELTFFLYNPDIYDKDKQTISIVVTRKQLEKDIEKASNKLVEFKDNLDNLKKSLWK